MKKFLEKYKYTSLMIGALAIAVVSGVGGAFVYKENVCKQEKNALFVKQGKEFNKLFEGLFQCHNFVNDKLHLLNLSKHQERTDELYNKTLTSPTEENTHKYLESAHSLQKHERGHDHKDGSCCEACSRGLSHNGGDKKAQAEAGATNASGHKGLQDDSNFHGVSVLDFKGPLSYVDDAEIVEKIKIIKKNAEVTHKQMNPRIE